MTPTVSVIIPLYNKSATIGRTLASILGQTFTDFEVIVVDDGSTDSGPQMVEACPDPRLRLVRQENAGPGAARNYGAELAAGQYVTFLDADDEWRPEFLERAVSALEQHGGPALYAANFYVEPAGVERWADLRPKGVKSGQWWWRWESTKDEIRYGWRAIHSCATVYRKKDFLDAGGFYENRCTFGEDVWLWIRLLTKHSVYLDDEPLAHYHAEDSSLGIGGRKGALPVEPILTDPLAVRATCKPALRRTLELWLTQHAAAAAFMQLERGNRDQAQALFDAFPMIREWRVDYWKLQARLAFPGLWEAAKALRLSPAPR